jgi:hypothetical protein
MVFALIGTSAAAPAIRVRVDNEELQFDAQPFAENDRTLVPVRALAEKLGFTVGWDEADQKVTLTRGDTVILLWIGSNRVVVNGKEGTIDVPPKKVNDRTFIPVRFVSEQLGTLVRWDDAEQTVRVTTGEELIRQMNQKQAAQINQRQVGDLQITMEMSDPQKPSSSISFNMPMHMDAQTYQNDTLYLASMEMPAALGLGELRTGAAIKDGKIYTLDSQTNQWRQVGTVDPSAAREQARQGEQSGLSGLTQIQADALKNVSVRIAGEEEMDGVKVLRLDADLSKVNYTEELSKAFGSLLSSGSSKLDVQHFTATYWMDPETQFIHKTAIDLSMNVTTVQNGKPVAMKLSMKGEIKGTLLTAPIAFPDFAAREAIDTYWAWLNTEGDPGPCIDAADAADEHWKDKNYAQGKADAMKASQCFASKAAQWSKVTPPGAFATAHGKLTVSFGGVANAYAAYAQAFDLATQGKVDEANAKAAEADDVLSAAQGPMREGINLLGKLADQYGLK